MQRTIHLTVELFVESATGTFVSDDEALEFVCRVIRDINGTDFIGPVRLLEARPNTIFFPDQQERRR